jgi:hypothetical protein
MSGFLRENWKWIVVPILVVLLALVAFVVLGGGENTSPFQYSEY